MCVFEVFFFHVCSISIVCFCGCKKKRAACRGVTKQAALPGVMCRGLAADTPRLKGKEFPMVWRYFPRRRAIWRLSQGSKNVVSMKDPKPVTAGFDRKVFPGKACSRKSAAVRAAPTAAPAAETDCVVVLVSSVFCMVFTP